MIPMTLKDCTAFIDGFGWEGRVKTLELPKINFKTEDFRGGGMDTPVPIEMGVEALMCAVTFHEMSPQHFGLLGRMEAANEAIVFRGSQEKGALVLPIIATMRGGFKSMDPGTWTPGSPAETKYEGGLTYYKLEVNGQKVIEIDPENSVRIIDGTDQLLARRIALGLV